MEWHAVPFFFLVTVQPKPPSLPANNVHDPSASTVETLASADKKSEVVGGQDGFVSMDTSLHPQPKDNAKSKHPDSVGKERKKKKHKQHRGM